MSVRWPRAPGLTGLVFGQAWFALQGLGEEPMAIVRRLLAGGWRLLETPLFREPTHVAAVRDAGLRIGAAVTGIGSPDEVAPAWDAAVAAGADYVRCKLLSAHHDDEAVSATLDAIEAARERTGMPTHVETHRDTATQDLARFCRHLAQRPLLRVTLDLSHPRVCGDWPDAPRTPEHAARLDLVRERVGGFHGRVSNGEQIQVPLLPPWDGAVRASVAIWAAAIRRWRAQAPADAWCPFVCELLPPPYALVDGAGREIGDRRVDALRLASLVARAVPELGAAVPVAC